MKTQYIKRIVGLIFLGVFIAYFTHKLFTTVDSTLLAVLILSLIVFVIAVIAYMLNN